MRYSQYFLHESYRHGFLIKNYMGDSLGTVLNYKIAYVHPYWLLAKANIDSGRQWPIKQFSYKSSKEVLLGKAMERDPECWPSGEARTRLEPHRFPQAPIFNRNLFDVILLSRGTTEGTFAIPSQIRPALRKQTA